MSSSLAYLLNRSNYLFFLGFNLFIWQMEKIFVLVRTYLQFNLFSNSIQDSSKNKFRYFTFQKFRNQHNLIQNVISLFLHLSSLPLSKCSLPYASKIFIIWWGKRLLINPVSLSSSLASTEGKKTVGVAGGVDNDSIIQHLIGLSQGTCSHLSQSLLLEGWSIKIGPLGITCPPLRTKEQTVAHSHSTQGWCPDKSINFLLQ